MNSYEALAGCLLLSPRLDRKRLWFRVHGVVLNDPGRLISRLVDAAASLARASLWLWEGFEDTGPDVACLTLGAAFPSTTPCCGTHRHLLPGSVCLWAPSFGSSCFIGNVWLGRYRLSQAISRWTCRGWQRLPSSELSTWLQAAALDFGRVRKACGTLPLAWLSISPVLAATGPEKALV